jgi:hypothetical protein
VLLFGGVGGVWEVMSFRCGGRIEDDGRE